MANHTVTNYADMVLSHGNIGGCSPLIDWEDIAHANIASAVVVIITVLTIFVLRLW